MSSPAPTTAPLSGDLSDPPGPSPLPLDLNPRGIENEGSVESPSPPSDVPNVGETEHPTVLDNPLTTDDTGQPEAEETQECSDNGDTTTTISTAPGHVTECATVYSVLMACITTSYTALYAYYARTGDEKVYKFWKWIIAPMAVTAVGISFALKPRREDWAYKVFLVLQYVLFTFVSEILAVVGYDFSTSQIIESSVKSLVWLAFLKFGLKSRSHIAKLSDADLSKFLTNDVIKGGMLVGLAQLTFLMFASIQCDGNVEKDKDCVPSDKLHQLQIH